MELPHQLHSSLQHQQINQQQQPHSHQQSMHFDSIGGSSSNQQQFAMHHQQAHHYSHPISHGRASAPALPVFPSAAVSAQQSHGGLVHTGVQPPGALGAPLPHTGQHPHQLGAPSAGPDADPRDQRRATLPLAHTDLELELQIRHNMLIEQQHRIAQLEEELNRSRAEVNTFSRFPHTSYLGVLFALYVPN
jgi:hypothetical protein